MNIGFVCNEYPPAPHGGVGVFVKTMAEALARQGHKVVVAGLYPGARSPAGTRENGVQVWRIPVDGQGGRAAFFRRRWKLARIVGLLAKQERLEVIEAPEGGGWSLFFAPACPVVVRLHSTATFFRRGKRRGRLLSLAERLALRRAAAISAVSRFIAREAPRLYPWSRLESRDIKIIPNGIDGRLFSQVPYCRRVPGRIVFAGTLKPAKGLETLFRGFARAAPQLPDASLYLYGKDTRVNGCSYYHSLLASVKPLRGIRERLHYAGPLPLEAMPAAYAASSVCVFPSLAESFGLVAGEAMSCGRPVVYSDASAGPELIEAGVSGILCDPADPEALALAISDLLSHPQKAEQLGLAAALRIRQHFSLQQCVDETLKFYQNLVS